MICGVDKDATNKSQPEKGRKEPNPTTLVYKINLVADGKPLHRSQYKGSHV